MKLKRLLENVSKRQVLRFVSVALEIVSLCALGLIGVLAYSVVDTVNSLLPRPLPQSMINIVGWILIIGGVATKRRIKKFNPEFKWLNILK